MTTPKVKIELSPEDIEFLITIFGNSCKSDWILFINGLDIQNKKQCTRYVIDESYNIWDSLLCQYKNAIQNNLVDIKQSWIDDVVSGDTELSYEDYSKLHTFPKNLFENIIFEDSK